MFFDSSYFDSIVSIHLWEKLFPFTLNSFSSLDFNISKIIIHNNKPSFAVNSGLPSMAKIQIVLGYLFLSQLTFQTAKKHFSKKNILAFDLKKHFWISYSFFIRNVSIFSLFTTLIAFSRSSSSLFNGYSFGFKSSNIFTFGLLDLISLLNNEYEFAMWNDYYSQTEGMNIEIVSSWPTSAVLLLLSSHYENFFE